MRVTVLSGGIGGARFLLGLRELGHEVTVIGNTGDDVTILGQRICPDLDTVMYTLGNGISVERGWGREAESFRVRDELTAYASHLDAASGADSVPSWFGLGDLDLATHLLRSTWLAAGVPLSEVTRRLCERWQPGVRLLPATDTPIETHVDLVDGRRVHFQEWWVRMHAEVAARAFEVVGADGARPAPGVIEALHDTDLVVLPPSNPVVSVGVILAVPGIAEALGSTTAPVVGLAPIVGDAPVRGMADACLAAIGVDTTADAVALHYGARASGGLIDGWLVDTVDAARVPVIEAAGIRTRAVPLMMTDLDATADMARAALTLASEAGRVTARIEIWGVEGLPEIQPGNDLASMIVTAGTDAGLGLRSGDVVVVTSKAVSKAEGRLVAGTRDDHLAAETARVVAARREMQIVQTHHGFVMAAAGIDASNVPAGTVALLPRDPDASARTIRDGLRTVAGVDVAVIVSDTMGRPWRNGVIDAAIGTAGLDALWDLRGQHDLAGHLLEATVIAVADELASAAELVKGKLAATPVAVVRGFPFTRNDPELGAQVMVRVSEDDMFSLGTREARLSVVADSAPVPRGEVNTTSALTEAQASSVVHCVGAIRHAGVDLTVSADGRTVTASGDPLLAGIALGRVLVALAAEGLRGRIVDGQAALEVVVPEPVSVRDTGAL